MQNIVTAYGIAYQVTTDEMIWTADRNQVEGLRLRIEGCPVDNDWEITVGGKMVARHESLDAAQRAVAAAFEA